MKTAKQLITDTIIGLINTNEISVKDKGLEIACLKAWEIIPPYAEYTSIYAGDYILNVRIDRDNGEEILLEVFDEKGTVENRWTKHNPTTRQLIEGLSTVLRTFIDLTNKG